MADRAWTPGGAGEGDGEKEKDEAFGRTPSGGTHAENARAGRLKRLGASAKYPSLLVAEVRFSVMSQTHRGTADAISTLADRCRRV